MSIAATSLHMVSALPLLSIDNLAQIPNTFKVPKMGPNGPLKDSNGNVIKEEIPILKPSSKRDLQNEKIGIVHIGATSIFFHSHFATYLDDLLNLDPAGAYGVCAVSIRRPKDEEIERAARLRAEQSRQNGLYTILQKEKGRVQPRVIASVKEYLAAYEDPQAVMERLISPDVSVVSLTITPRSYKANVNENIVNPESWIGYVLKALLERKKLNLPPFTLLSCDNATNNGDLAKSCILALAEHQCSAEDCDWIESNLKSPNTMVDRITRATGDDDRKQVSALGYDDIAPIVTEPFRQFAIHSDVGPNFPPLNRVGVEMTEHVKLYEISKLWGLNGGHRGVGYVGFLSGLKHVDEAFTPCETCRRTKGTGIFIAGLMEEYHDVIPNIPGLPPDAKDDYIANIIKRFANTSIKDPVLRVGQDGMEKVPGRVLEPLRAQLARGGETKHLSFVVAAWIRFLAGVRDWTSGATHDIHDPLAESSGLKAAAREVRRIYDNAMTENGAGTIDLSPVLTFAKVFGTDLPSNPRFIAEVSEALKSIYDVGVEKALEAMRPKPVSDTVLREQVTINGLTLQQIATLRDSNQRAA